MIIKNSNHRISILFIFLFGVLLYANTWTHGYTQDDAIVIYDNMFTTDGVSGIPSILKYDTFYGFFKEEGKAMLVSGGRYRPFSLISFAIEWEIFGKNPSVSHAINSLLYGILGIVIYLSLLQFNNNRTTGYWLFPAVVSLVFLAHPVHTEVVANIKGRDEIFCLLFSLLALISSFNYLNSRKKLWALAAGLSIFIGCMSKENAINFLLIIPLAMWFFTAKKPGKIAISALPVVIGGLTFIAVRICVLGLDFGSGSWELMNNPFIKIEDYKYVAYTLSDKIATILFTLGKYIQLLFLPHPLTHDYYPRHIPILSMANPKVFVSLLMYISLLFLSILGWKRKHWVSFGIIYYLIGIFLVSNILFPVGTNMSERFLFMPSLGWCLIAGGAICSLDQKYKSPTWLAVLTFVFIGILSALTVSRNKVWKDDFTLFTSDVRTSPNSAKLRNAVGGVLYAEAFEEKNLAKKDSMIREAIRNLEIALKIHPNYKNAHLIMGNCYFSLREHQQAETSYEHALRLDPGFGDAVYNNAVNNRELGRYFGSQIGDLNEAVVYLDRAYKVLNNDYETIRLLGTAYGYLGEHDKAVNFFLRALEQSPESTEAHINLAKSYFNAGNQEMGNQYLKEALKIDPNVLD